MSEQAIALTGVSKRFGPTVALDGVSFGALLGEVLGFVGQNGAGKSTALRIASGYLDADSGHAEILGRNVARERTFARAAIGYLPESVPLYRSMRVAEYLRYRARLKGVARRELSRRISAVCQRLHLSGHERRIIGHLSRGYRQRVGLADALIHDPPVLLFDEPTSGLDPVQRREFRALVTELAGEHTVILSSHELSEVELLADRIAVLDRGWVVGSGTLAELRQTCLLGPDASLEDVFVALTGQESPAGSQ
ncbi:MAG: ABC transporter ATP-binding protein [Proteobacteria bacterium]|nr:ABC transporter ATP-binding protein [Pseudomonadota bacterium]